MGLRLSPGPTVLILSCGRCFPSVRRTQVIDDESDYFATDSNQWLSKQEREALQKREQELRELRHASRLAKKITIDFAGRQILEEDNSMAEYHSK